jgi:hypothetical protein
MATQVKDSALLEWMAGLMGLGSRQTFTAAFRPDCFFCLLDELPLHLIPRRHFASQSARSNSHRQPLFLNPHCRILPPARIPEELDAHRTLLKKFDLQTAVAWVRDPATNSLLPFWLGPRLEALVASVRPGEPVSENFPQDARVRLADAGILVPQKHGERQIEQWSEISDKQARQFREKNYVPVENLIHPFHIAALRRYYRHAIRCGAIRLGDEQTHRRYAAHNESVARFFHHMLANAVSRIVGEPIKPSYVYFGSYLSGAVLKKHTDREQCEFSVTLCLDFSPEPEFATSWPIRVDTADGSVALYQALGDGLVYRGTTVPHYRHVLEQGCTSTSIFFHYVPEDFSGTLD